MKFEAKQPWWLGTKHQCGNCKGFTVLDSVDDEHLLMRTPTQRGERVEFWCLGCGAAIQKTEFAEPLRVGRVDLLEGLPER